MGAQRAEDAARRLAAALDRSDFEAARPLLADSCTYRMRDEVLAGAEAILASYARNAEWAERSFDRIEYESEVHPAADGRARILFTDRTLHRGVRHVYRCEQLVAVDANGRVGEITHVDLPGQSEALAAFLDRVGVARED